MRYSIIISLVIALFRSADTKYSLRLYGLFVILLDYQKKSQFLLKRNKRML